MYLPDPEQGYYRGTRFDWSGAIYSLTFAGHEYFGEWQQSDDPYLHDRITGPVESYGANTDVGPGRTFVRIGVGLCEKPAQSRPDQAHPFRVVNHGQWKHRQGANWIEMIHAFKDANTQQGYHYVKRLTLVPGKSELVIDHVLTNTGKQTITTDVYNHNFFVIDGQPTGPDFVVRFPFEPIAEANLKGFAEVSGKELIYRREIPAGEHIITLFTGFGSEPEDHSFAVENRKTKAGVSMSTDRAMSKLQYWSPRTTLCPEPFIDLNIKPNHSDRWSIRYTFYSLK